LVTLADSIADVLVFYFAGHGLVDDDGNLYLALTKTSQSNLKWAAVKASDIREIMRNAVAQTRILILDCCFSGRALQAMATPESIIKGTLDVGGTVTISSAPPNEASLAPKGETYTAFTRELLSAIASGDPSVSSEYLDLETIFRTVRGQLVSRGLPRPQILHQDDAHHIPFTRNTAYSGGSVLGRHRGDSTTAQRTDSTEQHIELRAMFVKARAELRLEHYDSALGLLDDLLVLDPRYPDAADLRDTARRGQGLAEMYKSACDAEDAGEWIVAGLRYASILQTDPDYRDAAARKAVCETQQQLGKLQAELQHHASVGQWHAALAVDAEIAQIDPSQADRDGLASEGRRALQTEQRVALLKRRYTRARASEDAGQWRAAVDDYDAILGTDPDYRDVVTRRDACHRRVRVNMLQSKLDRDAAAGEWRQVLVTIDELARLNPPGTADSVHTELARRARREVAAQPDEPLYRIRLIPTSVEALAWHPRASIIGVGCFDGHVRLYDLTGEESTERLAVKATRGLLSTGIDSLAFSADGSRLATGGDRTARIWDAATAQQLLDLRPGKRVTSVAFSPDGSRLATGSYDKTARIWYAASGRLLMVVRHDNLVTSVAFSPDGSRLATGSYDMTARMWDVARGKELLKVHHDHVVTSVAFSPDGSRLATGSNDMTARIWRAARAKQLLKVHHEGAVTSVAFSPDGSRLATGSDDKTARIWDATSGKQLAKIRHDNAVTIVAFSSDGSRLATSDRWTVWIWPAAVT
jgi:WD40 repeat protein